MELKQGIHQKRLPPQVEQTQQGMWLLTKEYQVEEPRVWEELGQQQERPQGQSCCGLGLLEELRFEVVEEDCLEESHF
jgi:hypothetical protein